MSRKFERVQKCYQVVREKTDFKPVLGVVLGSGLGNYASQMEVVYEIPYDDIPGFPVSTVEGHDGRFLFGYIGKVPTVLMKGRVHYYEGYSMEDVVLPIRLMKLMGIETLLLTNAAGGINPTFKVGDFMVITDQISSFVPSPLIGENVSEMGERFTDMTQIYD
jgi:purine-nucleoside phosphorylase